MRSLNVRLPDLSGRIEVHWGTKWPGVGRGSRGRRVLGLEAALRIPALAPAAVHQVISGQVQPGDPVVQLAGEHGPGFLVAGPHDDRDRLPGKGVVDDAAFGHFGDGIGARNLPAISTTITIESRVNPALPPSASSARVRRCERFHARRELRRSSSSLR